MHYIDLQKFGALPCLGISVGAAAAAGVHSLKCIECRGIAGRQVRALEECIARIFNMQAVKHSPVVVDPEYSQHAKLVPNSLSLAFKLD